jgi:hypothetical protein
VGAFPPEGLCFELPEIPTLDQICLPGGVCLDYIWNQIDAIPSMGDVSLNFFAQIGPALTPLKPFFDVLDVVLGLFRCVKAIPDAITSLNPSELIQCVPVLAAAVDKVMKLIPQLSIPKMVIAMIKNIARLIRSVATNFDYIRSQFQKIADMIDRAAEWNDQGLSGLLVCSQRTVEQTALSTAEALKGVGKIVLLINVMMGLFGGPEIPCFGSMMSGLSEGFDVVIDLLTALAELLDDIANSIPDPDLILTLALGESRC